MDVTATDILEMIAHEPDLRFDDLARRLEGARPGQDLLWAVYGPGSVHEFRRHVAALANGGGGVLLVGVPDEDGTAVPATRGPQPLSVGVESLSHWMSSALTPRYLAPMPDVDWHIVRATPTTGVAVVRVGAAETLPIAVSRQRAWVVPCRRADRIDHPTPWEALGRLEGALSLDREPAVARRAG